MKRCVEPQTPLTRTGADHAARQGAPRDHRGPYRPRRAGDGRHLAVAGWLLDKSAAGRARDPHVAQALDDLAGSLLICHIGELEQHDDRIEFATRSASPSLGHRSNNVASG